MAASPLANHNLVLAGAEPQDAAWQDVGGEHRTLSPLNYQELKMLVLSRKEGQEILIGDNIRILIVELRKYKTDVRIGIECPKELAIVRPDAKNQETKPRGWEP